MRTWLPFLALTAVACSSSGTWRRVDTQHFTLRTDLGSSDAKRAGAALETTRDALVSAAWPTFKFKDEKTEVYVLANGLDFERYFGRLTKGLFLHDSPPRFFLYGSADRWELRRSAHRPTPSVLRHEMAHQLSAEVWPQQSRWFSEGLANFLEPVFYSDDEKNVVIGAINYQALQSYRAIRTFKVEDALAWRAGLATMAQREAAGLYGMSWLFVHWLYYQHPEELGRFLDELERGSSAERALQVALPNLDLATIDSELFEYQRHARFDDILRPLVETQVTEASLQDRVLASGEIQEVKEVLAATSRMHLHPSHSEQAPDAPPKADTPVAAPVKKRIDYGALPTLPQYPCGPAPQADPAKVGSSPTEPATSRQGPKPSKDAPGRTAKPSSSQPAHGNLPPEVIQKIIRAGYANLRGCYEAGLRKNADLGGRVTVQFVIETDGSVSGAKPECTSMPDPAVVSCIVQRFSAFQFPQPSGGIVTVVYPVMFTPGD